jgi:hypothetical protein
MGMKKKYEAVATVGKYTDREGNEKKRYVNVGIVFEDDQGRLALKMDSVPVSPEWSGWISFFEPRERGESRPAPARPAQAQRPAANDDGDEIPF